jgi:pyruvate kinase
VGQSAALSRQLSFRRTKIVCTIGPASADEAALDRLIAAGMNVARLNMSHGDQTQAAETFARVRRIAAVRGAHVAILVDLQGPKIRTGPLKDGIPVMLETGAAFTITTRPVVGTAEQVSTTYPALPAEVRPGDRILLSDGLIELRCESVENDAIHCRVIEGGILREHQGINLPGAVIHAPSLTAKDEVDLRWAVEQGADYLAVSFVRRPDDVLAARRLLSQLGSDMPVVAKLEKPQALAQMDAILDVADGVMVARGDMGVELPPEDVPVWQKRIISAANARLTPVITATQMLESMVREPRPTRAEVTDVANAIWDGTDAVMLSAETSIGAHPVAAVAMMDRIVRAAEREPQYLQREVVRRATDDVAQTISLAAFHVGATPGVRAIAAFTRNGATARLVSKERPDVPILGFCADEPIARRLALYHGVIPIPGVDWAGLPAMLRAAETYGRREGLLADGDLVVLLGHLPLEMPGSTNFLMLHRVRHSPADRSEEAHSTMGTPEREGL